MRLGWSISKPARALRALRHPPRWLSMVSVPSCTKKCYAGPSRGQEGSPPYVLCTGQPQRPTVRTFWQPLRAAGMSSLFITVCYRPSPPRLVGDSTCPSLLCVTDSRLLDVKHVGPGGRQSFRARCVTQGSVRYSPSTGAFAATSTASPNAAPPAPASHSAATRPPATKSTMSAHS